MSSPNGQYLEAAACTATPCSSTRASPIRAEIANPESSSARKGTMHQKCAVGTNGTMMVCVVLFAFCFMAQVNLAAARQMHTGQAFTLLGAAGSGMPGMELANTKAEQTKRANSDNGATCRYEENELLHAFMDRVCEMCHALFSHEDPDLRAGCRKDCFNNDLFKRCASLFARVGSPSNPLTSVRRMARSQLAHYYSYY